MKDIECPHCQYVNRVAGLFDAGKAEGARRIVLYCAFCGDTFTPPETAEDDYQEALQEAGTQA